MEKCKIQISPGVAALIANAHQTVPAGKKYYFEGDLSQMSKAASVAGQLGIEVGINGGLPFIQSKDDYDKVIKYIVDNQIDGYWHYQ